jgi:hypothetical protein
LLLRRNPSETAVLKAVDEECNDREEEVLEAVVEDIDGQIVPQVVHSSSAVRCGEVLESKPGNAKKAYTAQNGRKGKVFNIGETCSNNANTTIILFVLNNLVNVYLLEEEEDDGQRLQLLFR